jgi:hypothetical protein
MLSTRKQRHDHAVEQNRLTRLLKEMPQMHDLIAMEDAVAFLVERVHHKSDRLCDTRKKVRQRIERACGNGELKPDSRVRLVFGSLINWAWTKEAWEPHLRDLPALNVATCCVQLPTMSVDSYGYALPSTIEECHTALHDAHARIVQLMEENTRLQKAVGA